MQPQIKDNAKPITKTHLHQEANHYIRIAHPNLQPDSPQYAAIKSDFMAGALSLYNLMNEIPNQEPTVIHASVKALHDQMLEIWEQEATRFHDKLTQQYGRNR
uniref:Uncharacterized protein n=1 Tax=uncultured Thiotrichaceae bacterium TaxID=298394 RepID=A0A6S6UEN4_9GAMM|nr:MAG: Unknown protein [uncultured Thiotrichaceae bacterium]